MRLWAWNFWAIDFPKASVMRASCGVCINCALLPIPVVYHVRRCRLLSGDDFIFPSPRLSGGLWFFDERWTARYMTYFQTVAFHHADDAAYKIRMANYWTESVVCSPMRRTGWATRMILSGLFLCHFHAPERKANGGHGNQLTRNFDFVCYMICVLHICTWIMDWLGYFVSLH